MLVAIASLVALIGTIVLISVSEPWPKPTPIAGDPGLYGDIADAILSGGLPYIDVTVEHLPVLLAPILAVGAVARLAAADFAALWPLVTIGAVIGAVALAGRITVVDRYQDRFAIAVIPMLPLIIYRLEVFVVVLALAAIGSFARDDNRSGSAWTIAGALAKGWPIVLFALPFRRGAARLALMGATSAVALLAVVALLPGFREGRAFTGVHAETVAGNLLLLVRHITDADLGLIGAAGATYVEAPAIAIAANAMIGIVVGLVALRAMFQTTELVALLRICGLATLAIILISPLFSAQFVFWLTPFVPLLTRTNRQVAFVAALLSMLVAAFWNPFEAWWALEVAVRNGVVLLLAARWAAEVIRHRDTNATRSAAEHLA
jgi:hypothetical protein